MELKINIKSTDSGIVCAAVVDNCDAMNSVEANVFALGALEIAKASLLARRWGVNIGSFPPEEPLVQKEPTCAP